MLKFITAVLSAALSLTVNVHALEAAKADHALPEISAVDENGAQFSLNQFKDKMGIVVFFFPKAFTGGCVCENNGFRDYAAAYQQKGYVVLGASRDDPKILRIFKEKYGLNYTLLSDPNDDLANALGLHPGKRDTIVIGKDGVVTRMYHDVNAPTHHKTLINEIQ